MSTEQTWTQETQTAAKRRVLNRLGLSLKEQEDALAEIERARGEIERLTQQVEILATRSAAAEARLLTNAAPAPPSEDERAQAERWARAHRGVWRQRMMFDWCDMPEEDREPEIAAMLPLVREARVIEANLRESAEILKAQVAEERRMRATQEAGDCPQCGGDYPLNRGCEKCRGTGKAATPATQAHCGAWREGMSEPCKGTTAREAICDACGARRAWGSATPAPLTEAEARAWGDAVSVTMLYDDRPGNGARIAAAILAASRGDIPDAVRAVKDGGGQ